MRKVTAIMVSTIMIATLFTCAISTFAQSTYNALNAEIDLKPDHLNLKSRGKWVTGYIELPSGYEPAEIDISTIKLKLILENPFQLPSIPVERQEVVIGDYDNDGISDLMVKFLRIKLGELIYSDSFVTKQVQSGAYNIQVSGQLTQGISFKGYDNFALTFRIPTGLGVHITEVGHRQPQGACTVYA
ncbi:MAG: hypothetical protein JSW28_05295 [Thermoplasmata archaeon]|nr:MAG: hypothetical protein JSW28_05295 [Thermoplasmata archaeon]